MYLNGVKEFIIESGLTTATLPNGKDVVLYLSDAAAKQLAESYIGLDCVNFAHSSKEYWGICESIESTDKGYFANLRVDSIAASLLCQTDQQGKKAYGISTGYLYDQGPAGKYNDIPYDVEVLNPEGFELSIVANPRYNKSKELATNSTRLVARNSLSGREILKTLSLKEYNMPEFKRKGKANLQAELAAIKAENEKLKAENEAMKKAENADSMFSDDMEITLVMPDGQTVKDTLANLLAHPEFAAYVTEKLGIEESEVENEGDEKTENEGIMTLTDYQKKQSEAQNSTTNEAKSLGSWTHGSFRKEGGPNG